MRFDRIPGSRRGRLVLAAAAVAVTAAGAVGVVSAGAQATPASAAVSASVTSVTSVAPTSVADGFTFLDDMMDKYATGSTTRLVQSYTGGFLQNDGFTDSVTYDDALVVDALLARGTADDVSRAKVIGNALLYVQANDASKDGRVRAAYAPTPLTSPSKISATDPTSDVGNMAWVGQALVQLYAKTGDAAYLTGATSIGTWIQNNTYDTRGAGGYTGGVDGTTKITWKSTEHNIDVYALFTMLATETGNATWNTRAASARAFVYAMWDTASKKYWVGTNPDGVSLNTGFLPEDVNTWTYLMFKDPAYSAAMDWDVTHLAATDGAFHGVSFGACDTSKVWFEGTAHLADALELRNAAGDAAKAQAYLATIQLAQTTAPNQNGLGIVAASHDGLSDCDTDKYYASLHTGATSWYLMAAGRIDPFLLLGSSTPADDFSLSATPASGSVTAGGTATATVSTTVTSGGAQTVTLTAGGGPAGSTATLTPASVTAGGSSTLSIATAAGTTSGTYQITVTGTGASGSHTATYTLTVGTVAGPTSYESENSANTLSGSANVIACSACSGGHRVGHLGKQSSGTGTLTFTGITAAGGAGTYQIAFAYTDGSGTRTAQISVNGGAAITVSFGTTGSFSTPGTKTVPLALAAGTNTIAISNASSASPDMDKITVPGSPS